MRKSREYVGEFVVCGRSPSPQIPQKTWIKSFKVPPGKKDSKMLVYHSLYAILYMY